MFTFPATTLNAQPPVTGTATPGPTVQSFMAASSGESAPRPSRARQGTLQAANPILKEKLSPQNAVMPMPVAASYPSFAFGQPAYHAAPALTFATQQPQSATGTGALFFTSAAPSAMPQGFMVPAGSPLMFAGANSCAPESFLQQEIAMSFLASQQASAQPHAAQLAGQLPTIASSPFLVGAPANLWAPAPPTPSSQGPMLVMPIPGTQLMALYPQPSGGVHGNPSAAKLGEGPAQPPQYGDVFAASTSTASASQSQTAHSHKAASSSSVPPQKSSSVTTTAASSGTQSGSTGSKAATAATATPPATAATTPARVAVEEGKTFEEDPVPIDTTRCQLIVNFLSQRITNSEFRDLFRPYGELFEHASHIIYDFRHAKGVHAASRTDSASQAPLTSARSKGYGFIYFRDGASTAAAIRELNGKDVYGRRIKVRYAEQQRSVEDILREEERALMEASVNDMLESDDDM